MPKAKTIDRVELTRRKFKTNAKTLIPQEYTKENSPFLKMREEMRREHPEEFKDGNICPECGGELEPWEGCKRCKECGISLC